MKRRREGQARFSVEFAKEYGRHGRLQWYAADRLPALIARAARQEGYSSSAHYIRSAIIHALARDIGVDFEALNAEQPSKMLNSIYSDPTRYGANNSVEEVI
jgi:hypothetical protein